MGQKGERVEGPKGEAGREVVPVPLDDSVMELNLDRYNGISFDGILQLCTSIDNTGCVLAWCLVNAESVSRIQGNSNLAAIWFNSGVQLQGCSKRQPFPMSEGGLDEVVTVLSRVAISDVVAAGFTMKWRTDAWSLVSFYGLNALWIGACPVPKGPWTGMKKKLAAAVKSSVERLEATSSAQEISIDVVKNELGRKRVSYSGEEVSVCVPLTYRQVVASLPPKNAWWGH